MHDDATHPVELTREEFLTARQLASILQVSESTVRRLAQTGRIPSIRITPRITRYNLQAVRDALDGASHRHRPRRPHEEPSAENPQLSFKDLF